MVPWWPVGRFKKKNIHAKRIFSHAGNDPRGGGYVAINIIPVSLFVSAKNWSRGCLVSVTFRNRRLEEQGIMRRLRDLSRLRWWACSASIFLIAKLENDASSIACNWLRPVLHPRSRRLAMSKISLDAASWKIFFLTPLKIKHLKKKQR